MHKLKLAVGLGAVAYFATVAVVDNFDQQLSESRAEVGIAPSINALSADAFAIMNNNGCAYCHTSDSDMPFYGQLPVAKQLMDSDVERGTRHFNIEGMMTQVREGELVSELELAKLESVLDDGSMPPPLYLSMHWRSKLSSEETATLRDWVKQERMRHHINSAAKNDFKYDAVQPITTEFEVDMAKVELGNKLFHDTRLSGDNTVSCASCHSLATGGVDRLTTSLGVNNAVGPINAPTVYNAVFNSHQFWDGRAADLQAQAGGPPLNPLEMASESWHQISEKLLADEDMQQAFAAIYDEGITEHTITDAIAEFEKTLVTPNSRFDQFLRGDEAALSADEKEGYALFKQHKCATCHVGEAMGGQGFEVMGLKKDYFAERGNVTDVDNGRFNVTGDPADMHRFKVPTLRNVALTAPYFHDGQAATLEQAVDQMAYYQVGVKLTASEISKITAYLETLTGEYQGQLLQ
ncbi:cytochrome-c peroxidase [Photobacterium jeanii]|uniref:Cytochrome-c peroxidase n=1 Tax=Photobacterium jeanii TaxID=858640 RepID=A0A178KPF5_9GAMM|nr:cytochrome c peroxidase [Photobacterium jeanii]OAN18442.1 cytochrome-c peroxidase [Photobacterium jeanii]PST91877.1 cytochrome-c peroxidase [Photobacterium jeanii]